MMALRLDQLRQLPAPTAEQRRAFVELLSGDHSWYKHLSFRHPGTFVVFANPFVGDAPDALSRDRVQVCGRLDYLLTGVPDPHAVRERRTIRLPPEIERACSFELGPCCSNDTNAIEEIVHIWGSNADPDPVWSGDARQLDPALRRSIDALGAAAAERWRLYAALTDVEREHAIELEDSGALPRDTVSEGVRQYLDSVRRSAAHYDALRAPEVAKIERAIDALGVVLGW